MSRHRYEETLLDHLARATARVAVIMGALVLAVIVLQFVGPSPVIEGDCRTCNERVGR